jgi:hypothetical protein
MGDFTDAVEARRGEPFPRGADADDLDEFHADLALADAWVAEAVIPLVDRGIYRPPSAIDVLGELQLLRERASRLGLSAEGDHNELIRQYSAYVTLLIEVYLAFLREGGPRT